MANKRSLLRRVPLAAALLLVLASVGTAAAATKPSGVTTLRGKVSVRMLMARKGSAMTRKVAIEAADGKRYEVTNAKTADQLAQHPSAEVTATGKFAASTATATVDHFTVDRGWGQPFKGARTAAVIRWTNSKSTYAQSASSLKASMFTASDSVAAMWNKESGGKLTLTGDVFTETVPDTVDPNTCPEVNYYAEPKHPGYDFYLMVGGYCPGIAGMAGIYSTRTWYYGTNPTSVFQHEMGHNLGFGHSHSLVNCYAPDGTPVPIVDSPDCFSNEYGDNYTPMGSQWDVCSFDAYQEIIAGFRSQWSQVTSDSTVQLRAHNLTEVPGIPSAIAIAGVPAINIQSNPPSKWQGKYYFLDWRTTDYPNCPSKNDTGIQIRIVDNADYGEGSVLVNQGTSNLALDNGTAALALGQTYRDPFNGTAITLVSRDLTTGIANVKIAFNAPPPPPPPPPTTAVVASGKLTVTGDDTADTLNVRDDSAGVIVENSNPVRVGAGCTLQTAKRALCTGVTSIVIDGGKGDDDITTNSMKPVNVNGGKGSNTIHASATPDGPTTYSGNDWVDYSARTGPLSLTTEGTANDGSPREKDNITKAVYGVTGGSGNDKMVGASPDGNSLSGGPGNDTITGKSGYDVLDGGPGNDVLNGGGADDVLTGGDGNDRLNGGGGQDMFDAGAGDDIITAKDRVDEHVDCGAGNDAASLDGPAPADRFYENWFRGDTPTGCETVTH